jgi:plasmid stability protein
MSDMLIRDVPEPVIAALDARARRLGLSRSEYLRRVLAREQRAEGPVTASDLVDFAERFRDLGDDEVMEQAWR